MRTGRVSLLAALLVALSSLVSTEARAAAPQWTVLGWNDLGMHCMDSDYSVFAILPPFNNVRAQLIDPAGHLASATGGLQLHYEAVADADGSINSTSVGKTGFWSFTQPLFGVSLLPDQGLAGCGMPGLANVGQPMAFDTSRQWFAADGVPLTPYDDAGHKNPYPLMRLVLRDGTGTFLAATSVVLPVSDEMDCSKCHASGTVPEAKPAAGWVNDPDPARDFRLNILRLHDDRQIGSSSYSGALEQLGLDPEGLYANVQNRGNPVLCAACHASNALPGTGVAGISALTSAVHLLHGNVHDPANGMTLNSSENRSACYSCHPGSSTRCLRGAMGAAIASDGSMAMQCQSCHGNMSQVGAVDRTGWLQQPSCQNCHTGTAVDNAGAIRYTSAFTSAGVLRPAANPIFATNADQPAAGFNLFRFSTGHGGLYCEACHGSTHAEFPSSHRNDNLQSTQLQGHAGVISDCKICHATTPTNLNGPHGLHPIGSAWISRHGDFANNHTVPCKDCHEGNYRGGVLSASQADLTVSTRYGVKNFWRGFRIGCYTCHNGPNSDNASPNHAPTVLDASISTSALSAASVVLTANDTDGDTLTLRIVSQPAHGAVALLGNTVTYLPDGIFSGDEEFTFAASDTRSDSNLGHVMVHVLPGLTLFQDGFEN
jgi:hypothetical protein